jgi:Flp pilus assembly pilin Flp
MLRTPRRLRDRHGQGLVEYALIISLVGVGLTAALVLVRNSIGNTYNGTADRIAHASDCTYGAGTCPAGGTGAGAGGSGGQGNGGGNGQGNNGNGNGNGGGNGSNAGGNGNGNGGGRR